MWGSVLILVFLIVVAVTRAQPELLVNQDFEDAQLTPWVPIGSNFDFRVATDAISGEQSVKTAGRYAYWNGPGQVVNLKPNTNYIASGYIKLLNDKPGKLFQWATIIVSLDRSNGPTTYINVARQSFLTVAKGWVKLQGTFRTTTEAVFLCTSQFIPYFSVQLPPQVNPSDIEIEVRQVKQSFAFGTVVSDKHLLDPLFKPYSDLLFGMFNWFTVASYKWSLSQADAFNLNYNRATKATDLLRQHGFPVRAHTMFWGVEDNVPEAVKQLTPDAFNTSVYNRVQHMTGITNGKVAHWDVNNELLHGVYFEEKTGDIDYTKTLFSWIHQADPSVKLFLNDYEVLSSGSLTRAYLDVALDFKKANVGLYGLGVQAHMPVNVEPDPVLLKSRLDLLSQAGLPIWITELDVVSENETVRADWYETVWRLCYSQPAVEGIVLWGLWSRTQYRQHASLVSGNSYYINESGKRWLQLTQNEWMTQFSHPLSMGNRKVFRGFHGDYEIIVKQQGQPIKLQRFSVGKSPSAVTVVLEGNEQTVTVSIPTPLPPYISTSHPHRVFTVNQRLDGKVTSVPSSTLQCVNRLSSTSAIGDDQSATVSCQAGEVMTSCSMVTEDHSWIRDGEKYMYNGGQVICAGFNGFRSSAGVRSQARCCKLTGLSCEYLRSGPQTEPLRDGDQAETQCSAGNVATGCMSHSYFLGSDGSFHKQASCVAQVDGISMPGGGVVSYAICCSAPQLQCRIIQSAEGAESPGAKVTTQCAASEVMVGCSVYSEDGRTAGAQITDGVHPLCEGVGGIHRFPGESGVQVSAVCCSG